MAWWSSLRPRSMALGEYMFYSTGGCRAEDGERATAPVDCRRRRHAPSRALRTRIHDKEAPASSLMARSAQGTAAFEQHACGAPRPQRARRLRPSSFAHSKYISCTCRMPSLNTLTNSRCAMISICYFLRLFFLIPDAEQVLDEMSEWDIFFVICYSG
jgi:hypothetical protein